MRRNAGFMMTLLLLAVPALANAWTLTVKVAGGTAAQPGTPVTVSYLSSANAPVTTTLKIGTNYLYPKDTVDFTALSNGVGLPSYLLDGAVSSESAVEALAAGPHTVTLTYTAASVQYKSVSVAQATGGLIYAQALNNTWSTSSVAGYVENALVPITISADANYKITGYSVNTTPTATLVPVAPAVKVKTFTVQAQGQTLTPVFALDAKNAATLFAPTNGVAGTPITCTVTATSNDTGLKYAFSTDGGATFTAASTLASYTFTPAEGTYNVVAKLTSANDTTGVKTPVSKIFVANAQVVANSECTSCHSTQSPALVASYQASMHNRSVNSSCAACHTSETPHSTGINSDNISKSTFKVMTSHVIAGFSKNDLFCTKCHATAHILIGAASCTSCHNQNGSDVHTITYAKANHAGGKAAPIAGAVNVGDSTTQYLTQGAICTDCHNSTNSVLEGFAEGGHGKVSSEPMNPFAHYDWTTRSAPDNGSRQNGNCNRCHTAQGFIRFAQQDAALVTRLALQAGKPNNVLICVACHTNIESGALRTNATPSGNPTPLTGGYFALISTASASITTGYTRVQVPFPGYKNSSICIPCHAGRTTNTVFPEMYAKSKLANKNYSTLQNSVYQHAKNMAQTFTGQGAYDFSGTGQLALIGTTSHANIKMGAGDTQGPCVACHYTKTGTTHSLEVVVSDANCSAAACHPAGFSADSLKVSEENYKAGVKALEALIRSKFAPLWASGSNDLAGERTGYWRYGRFMKTPGQSADLATAQKAYGAWYNWQLLSLWDSAAYAHNSNYARKVLVDTVDYLDDGIMNNSAPASIATINTIVPNALTAAEVAAAADFTNGMATTKIMTRHADPSSATYKVQYTLTGSTGTSPVTCASCHNPSDETALQSEARKAWAESGHGETNALPWIPASNHLWRNAGLTVSYADAAAGNDCVRCHTPEGFAQFVAGPTPFTNIKPVASAADAATNSPLACNACHVNALNAASARLAVAQVTTYFNISSAGVQKTHIAATFPNVGESNMCIPCHAGRVSGAALADADAKGFNFTTNSFQNSHYMAAAGMMYVKSGFTAFVPANTVVTGTTDSYGQTLTAETDSTVNTAGSTVDGKLTSTHRKLGTTAIRGDSHNLSFFVPGNLDTNGPCVTCHLQGYTNAGDKRPGAGHSLKVDTAAWNQVCNACHAAEGIALIEEEKEPYEAALSILKTLVETKLSCEYDSGAYPYFFKAGFAHTAANAFKAFGNAKNEGAAFNLNLLEREEYAYVHARTYTRRLIYDTIDYLDDGAMNQSVSSYLASTGTIGVKPVDASGTTANDKVWSYFLKYDRTTKLWNAASERP